eukprot:34802-Amorphochlora_amoeboformis.AAC.1
MSWRHVPSPNTRKPRYHRLLLGTTRSDDLQESRESPAIYGLRAIFQHAIDIYSSNCVPSCYWH